MARYSPFIAAALIIAALAIGLVLMPRIMLAASGAGPFGGAAIAIAFILALFVVLWLRSRHQRRFDGE
jgi:predicted membrane protein